MSSSWLSWHMMGLLLVANLMLHITYINALKGHFSNSLSHPSCKRGSEMGIYCEGDASDREGGITLTQYTAAGEYKPFSKGYVFFDKPIKMRDRKAHQVASFTTQFTFNITVPGNYPGGDGMSFIMFGDRAYQGDAGSSLGVYNLTGGQGTPTFSIEFDTFRNWLFPVYDSSDNHVGVDVGSILSKMTRNTTDVGINLKGGQHTTAWIDYDASRKLLEIRIANNSYQKPSDPFILYILDLFPVVMEKMYVGIGASTGDAVEINHLVIWNFTSFGLPDDPVLLSRNKIVGISAAVIASTGILFISCIWWILHRRKRERALNRDFELQLPLEDMPLRFTYNQLSVATNGFDKNSQLGVGGSSSVYKGLIVSTSTPVAVKKVNATNDRTEGEKFFVSEVRVISRLRHRNLVKLLGWCRDRGRYLLVYELMPNGSLDKFLFKTNNGDDSPVLSWSRRLTIVRGVAAALAYLHEGYAQRIIHRDIKSSNVMLDEEFNPKVGDFGLARLVDHSKNLETMHVAGTWGYIAPEAVYRGVTNDKTDVYAFGTLVLEIVCGRPPVADDGVPADEKVLVDWVWKSYGEGDTLRAADRRLITPAVTEGGGSGRSDVSDSSCLMTTVTEDGESGEFALSLKDEISKTQLIGLLCCHPNPDDRPSMREVERYLVEPDRVPAVPRSKPKLQFDRERDEIRRLASDFRSASLGKSVTQY